MGTKLWFTKKFWQTFVILDKVQKMSNACGNKEQNSLSHLTVTRFNKFWGNLNKVTAVFEADYIQMQNK